MLLVQLQIIPSWGAQPADFWHSSEEKYFVGMLALEKLYGVRACVSACVSACVRA